ncbi:hypothetical protein A8C32_18970 [Flavivirga aquatica]|uniref:F0F1-ATPase subunit n=1 Tax=Flavivirga aquatica TaxID=1849968 RepID=A0A1E5T408_9FLAO|nr:AtpZ/AtpI family protein [Flavivirga aquatica]OEK06114.1 hypothetical protein A8C32_18970 [Flavivirga aquatica]
MAANNNEDQKPKKQLNPYIGFTTVAFQMGLTIYLGSELGNWLDLKYDKAFWKPTLTLFSVFIAMYLVINQVVKISNKK